MTAGTFVFCHQLQGKPLLQVALGSICEMQVTVENSDNEGLPAFSRTCGLTSNSASRSREYKGLYLYMAYKAISLMLSSWKTIQVQGKIPSANIYLAFALTSSILGALLEPGNLILTIT